MPTGTTLDTDRRTEVHGRAPRIPVSQRVLSVREAALFLGRSEKSIRHLVDRKKLRCIRADGRVMFDITDLENMDRTEPDLNDGSTKAHIWPRRVVQARSGLVDQVLRRPVRDA